MSADKRFGWFPRTAKKAPPAHGVKMKKAGATWWGKRWIEALEQVLRGDAGRLARGRTYARAGRAHDLIVKNGKISAKVTGSRTKPYDIEITLAQLSEAEWAAAMRGLAQKAQFSAELLAGQMPEDIDAVFREIGTSLFPLTRKDLVTRCSCPDWGDPCKHVAATHYVLGEALDRDPFLLFELRGKHKELVLEALRAARGGGAAGATEAARGRRSQEARVRKRDQQAQHAKDVIAQRDIDPRDAEIASVAFTQGDAIGYDKPRAPLPALHFSFDAPTRGGAVLRQLGGLSSWDREEDPSELLAPVVQAAAESARRIAMSEPAADEDVAANAPSAKLATRTRAKPTPQTRKRKRR